MKRSAKEFVRGPLIPDRPPDPAMQAELRHALGLDRRRPPPPAMADGLPDGLSEADAKPDTALRMPAPPMARMGPPPSRPADETAPAFAEITRVGLADLPQLGWLTARLAEHFPHIAPASWPGRLRSWMVDNSCLFVKTKNAVALATVARDPLGQCPYVLPVFCCHIDRGAEGGNMQSSPGERDAIQLLREAARWGKTLGAGELRHIADHCDVTPGRLVQLLTPTERRDELVMRIIR